VERKKKFRKSLCANELYNLKFPIEKEHGGVLVTEEAGLSQPCVCAPHGNGKLFLVYDVTQVTWGAETWKIQRCESK